MTRRAKERRAMRIANQSAKASLLPPPNSSKKLESQESTPFEEEKARQWNELVRTLSSAAATQDGSTLSWKSTNCPINAGGMFELPIQVNFKNATLSYQFHTKANDICFSVSMVSTREGEEESMLVEPTRFDAHLETVIGTYRIRGPTTLYLIWDNEYSWWNSKELAYTIELSSDENDYSRPRVLTLSERVVEAMSDRREAISQGKSTIVNLSNVLDSLNCSLSDVEHRITKLNNEKESIEKKLETVLAEKSSMEEQVLIWASQITGLTWQALTEEQLQYIFSFGTEVDKAKWSLVNRQWCDNNNNNIATNTRSQE